MRKGIFTAFCGVALLALIATLAQQARRSSPDPALIRAQPVQQAPPQQVQAQKEEKLLPDPERTAQARMAEELLKKRLELMAQSETAWPGFQRCLVGSASCLDLDQRPFILCKAGGAEACDRSATFVPLASK